MNTFLECLCIYTHLFYTLSADNGACLVRSEIASVSVQEEDFGTFVYITGENTDTVWPSKYSESVHSDDIVYFSNLTSFSL